MARNSQKSLTSISDMLHTLHKELRISLCKEEKPQMNISTKKQKGFTLIELVIVLAIAALILAGILIAVSGAQRSRRDAQRKTDAGEMLANAETYASNHGGIATGVTVALVQQNLTDPQTGAAYSTIAAGAGHVVVTAGTGAASPCGGGNLSVRQVAVQMTLESGDTACIDDK
jgi:prepilin-type N-terminal cleavage/methylation domain-containing protein